MSQKGECFRESSRAPYGAAMAPSIGIMMARNVAGIIEWRLETIIRENTGLSAIAL